MRSLKPLILVAFFLSSSFAGCAGTYRHPTKGPADFERDRQECEIIANKTLETKGPAACG